MLSFFTDNCLILALQLLIGNLSYEDIFPFFIAIIDNFTRKNCENQVNFFICVIYQKVAFCSSLT